MLKLARLLSGLAAVLLLVMADLSIAAAKPDANAVREHFLALLRARQFAALEAAMDGIHREYEQHRISEWQLDHALRAFQPQEWNAESPLNEWVHISPKAYQPYLARGLFHATRGGYERGDGWNDEDSSGEQLAAMRIAYESATSDLQRALQLNPRLPMAWAALLVIAGALDDRSELEHNLRAGLSAIPQSAAIRWTYAYALYYREADEELEAFVADTLKALPRSDPNYRSIGTWLDNFEGYRLLREREYPSAVRIFTQAIERDDRARLRIGRASAEIETGQIDAAITDLRTALRLRPWDDDALARLAEALWEQDKRNEAESLIAQAIALAPMYPGHRLIRASMRFESEHDEEALADLDIAQVYGRYDARVYHLRGEILTDRDPRAALQALDAARRLSPDSPPIQLSYAGALYRAADCRAPDALALYERMCTEAQSCSPRGQALRAMIEDAPCQPAR